MHTFSVSRKTFILLFTFTILLSIPVTTYLVQQSQDIRRKANTQITTLEGELQVIVHDDFINFKSHNEYYLKTETGKMIPLQFNEDPQLPSNTRIRVSSTTTYDTNFVQNTSEDVLKNIQILETSTLVPAVGEKKVAALMVNFENNPNTQPTSETEVRNMVFTSQTSVNSYFQEVSYGKLSLKGDIREDGDIFGWYTIRFNDSICDYPQWVSAANNAALNEGIDITKYDLVLYLFASGSCNQTAGADLNAKNSYYFLLYPWGGELDVATVAHEMLHNFGLMHANSYICRIGDVCFDHQVYISDQCVEPDYGDHFDVMGSGRTYPDNLPFHTNIYFKEQLGWLNPARVKTVTEDGIFTLHPTEISSLGLQSLKIPIKFREKNEFYFIEYRQSIGFDDYNRFDGYWMKQGVLIRISSEDSSYRYTAPSSLLIDSTPDNNCVATDGALQVGDTFVDQTRGITIKLISTSPSEAVVEIKFIDTNQDLILTNIPVKNQYVEDYTKSCDIRCGSFASECLSVGTDVNATNNRKYNNLCVEENARCFTIMENTENICFGNKTDWTNCKCRLPQQTPTPNPTTLPTRVPTEPPPTPTYVPTSSPIPDVPGDADVDGNVDVDDYVIWLNNYLLSKQGSQHGDFNNTGKVDGLDYIIWLNNYGT
jgi:hypothetical protein